MSRRNVTAWEANHPLNGSICPVTNRRVYIEETWKVSRPEYRLRTGILEPGVVLSLPVGHTRIDDTAAFFTILDEIRRSRQLNTDRFVLVEDYTLHTGSDYEGRITYIKRMTEEILPAGIIFIVRSTSWKMSIKIGTVVYGSPFPTICVPSYREALRIASEILERPLAGQVPVKSYDRIERPNFSISLEIISPSLLHVRFSGHPEVKDLSSIEDFYLGLPHHAGVTKAFRTIHDFSAMSLPSLQVVSGILRQVLSTQCNHGGSCTIVEGAAPGFSAILHLIGIFRRSGLRRIVYRDAETAIEALRPEVDVIPVFRENLQSAALEMLENIVWNQPGFETLEAVIDPQLKPLALMLGSIKQDIDYYLQQRQDELDTLEELNRRARQLSGDIEQAYLRSEEDRHEAEVLSEKNISLSREITSSQKEVFLVLADYIDRRAKVLEGSTRKLARLVAQLAVFSGYGEADRERLHDATLLMHTGYLAISEEEPDKELHCVFGGEVLGNIYTFIMQYASHIARYHHERWDGTGFPERLKGGDIPPEARLIAIADFLLSCHQGRIEESLRNESGKSFDPAMVAALLGRIDEVTTIVAAINMVGAA
ncbi:MAG: HD domain-containing protein [Chitinispirillaceae bacterium]|nr:HD domain-containing protein [Chitinispirillaceae bacterium]